VAVLAQRAFGNIFPGVLYGHVLELMDWFGFEQDMCADTKSSVASPSGLIAQALHFA
jgi:hypothetical protein